LNLKSIYTIENLSELASEDLEFQQYAQLKSTEKYHVLEIFSNNKNESISNHDILYALNDGASSLLFNFDKEENYSQILKGIYADLIPISCNYIGDNPNLFLNNWKKSWEKNNLNYSNWEGSFNVKMSPEQTAKFSLQLPKNVRSCCIDLAESSNLSLNDKLSFIYSTMVEMLQYASKYNLYNRFQVNWVIADEQIESIAALRAVRVLWAKAIKKYGVNVSDYPLWICGYTSLPKDYGNDPLNSLIFTSIQLLSASLGGVDECYNSSLEKDINEPRHYARHQSLVMLNETNIFVEKDSTKGSFAIEYLTHYLSKNAIS